MIHIKHKVDTSSLHGLGLFTLEDIPKGGLIYTASPKLDLNLPTEDFESLDQKDKEEIMYWGFKIESQDVWHVDFDMSKFINHSHDSNVTQDFSKEDAYLTAKRDIRAGEELTQDYLEFETEEDLKRRGLA